MFLYFSHRLFICESYIWNQNKGNKKICTQFQGLVYIHKTSLGSHGGLKSSNCLVDGRWTLKISGYGLYALKSRNSTSDIGDYEKYKKMLWTAPELLRSPNRPRYGTPKGDVYSFAIILQELVFRNMPFFLDLMTPKGQWAFLIYQFPLFFTPENNIVKLSDSEFPRIKFQHLKCSITNVIFSNFIFSMMQR